MASHLTNIAHVCIFMYVYLNARISKGLKRIKFKIPEPLSEMLKGKVLYSCSSSKI